MKNRREVLADEIGVLADRLKQHAEEGFALDLAVIEHRKLEIEIRRRLRRLELRFHLMTIQGGGR